MNRIQVPTQERIRDQLIVFESLTGQKYSLRRFITRGCYGLIFQARSLDKSMNNILIKVQNRQEADKEINVLQRIKFNQLEGFSTALDWGDMSDELC